MIGQGPFTGRAAVVALGIVVGATSAVGSLAPLAVMGAIVLLVVGLRYPSVAVAVVFVGILAAERGLTGVQVAGLPLTVSKITALFAIGIHVLNVGVYRRPLLELMPTSAGMGLVLVSMLLSLTTSLMPAAGYEYVASMMLLLTMSHVVYTMVPRSELPWLFRFMAIATIAALLWTLITQRGDGFYHTLDHAWMQRTSGAYDDPNVWATCLLTSTPLVLAFLVKDDHWTATPLLVVLGVLLPLGIVQSLSRAALVGFALVAPGLLWMVRGRRTLLLGMLVAAAVLVPLVIDLDSALLRYETLLDPSVESDLGHGSLRERTALLEAAIQIFLEHPALGVGVGMFRFHAAHLSAGEVWKVAHNSYANLAAEQGIPGIVAHLFFALQVFRAGWTWARHAVDPGDRLVGLGFLLGALAFAWMAATLNLANFSLAWFTLGVGMAYARWVTECESEAEPVTLPREVIA